MVHIGMFCIGDHVSYVATRRGRPYLSYLNFRDVYCKLHRCTHIWLRAWLRCSHQYKDNRSSHADSSRRNGYREWFACIAPCFLWVACLGTLRELRPSSLDCLKVFSQKNYTQGKIKAHTSPLRCMGRVCCRDFWHLVCLIESDCLAFFVEPNSC